MPSRKAGRHFGIFPRKSKRDYSNEKGSLVYCIDKHTEKEEEGVSSSTPSLISGSDCEESGKPGYSRDKLSKLKTGGYSRRFIRKAYGYGGLENNNSYENNKITSEPGRLGIEQPRPRSKHRHDNDDLLPTMVVASRWQSPCASPLSSPPHGRSCSKSLGSLSIAHSEDGSSVASSLAGNTVDRTMYRSDSSLSTTASLPAFITGEEGQEESSNAQCEEKASSSKRIRSISKSRRSYRENPSLSKIILLLLKPSTRKFELIQMFIHLTCTIGDILDQIPKNATELSLGNQTHRGLCRPKDGIEMVDRSVLAGKVAGNLGGCRIIRNEILIAIPEGFTGPECMTMSQEILSEPKVVKLLSRTDLLDPRKKRSSRSAGSRTRKRALKPQLSVTVEAVQEEEIKNLDSSTATSVNVWDQRKIALERTFGNLFANINEIFLRGGNEQKKPKDGTTNNNRAIRISVSRLKNKSVFADTFTINAMIAFLGSFVISHFFGSIVTTAPMGIKGIGICAATLKYLVHYQNENSVPSATTSRHLATSQKPNSSRTLSSSQMHHDPLGYGDGGWRKAANL